MTVAALNQFGRLFTRIDFLAHPAVRGWRRASRAPAATMSVLSAWPAWLSPYGQQGDAVVSDLGLQRERVPAQTRLWLVNLPWVCVLPGTRGQEPSLGDPV